MFKNLTYLAGSPYALVMNNRRLQY